MMAILPPTSPTTVMGGFSLAIITEKESTTRYLWEHFEDVLCTVFHLMENSVDWVKWVEKLFCDLGKSAPRIMWSLLGDVL